MSRTSLPGSSIENQTTWPEHLRRISRTSGSSALSTAWPSRGTASTMHGLDVGELLDGVDAAQAEVVGLHVEDDGDVVALVAEALAQDAAAGDLEDGEVDARVLQHHPRRPRAGGVGADHAAARR